MNLPETARSRGRIELVCPAGTLPALRAAVDERADWVYFGLRDATNARNFAGLNFSLHDAAAGIRYAHERGVKTLLAVNTYPQPTSGTRWRSAVDTAAELGVDALILADPGLMQYASRRYPSLDLHLSVQASATNYEAINLYHDYFGVKRAILPRVLSLAQVENVIRNTPVEIEVFGFGSLCVMVEGRCAMSAYVTGSSPNTAGACSPGHAVRWEQTRDGLESRLNGVLIDRYAENEKASYPTLCKARYDVSGQTYYAIEEPASLNALELLPSLVRMGVAAIKIEGRQRNASYVSKVTRIWREAIDRCARDGDTFAVGPQEAAALRQLSEGQQQTFGAYYRPWK
ncbi:MAG: ubiquinone anaerobic biosynthesis protein UbiU [Burkholderiales bacterium]